MTIVPDQASTYMAGRSAQRDAIDLLAYAAFEWPKALLDGDNPVTEKLHNSGISFAINARRFLEHTQARPKISETKYVRKEDDPKLETRLYEALHGLIHSTSLRIQYSPLIQSNYTNQEAYAPVFFVYETDRYPEKKASIFGIAWTFMTLPKPNIKLS